MVSNHSNELPEGFKMTELGPLPKEWEATPFTESLAKRRGNAPDSIQRAGYKPTGKYPIVDQSEKYIAGYTDDEEKIYSSHLPIIIFGDHTRIFKFVDFPFAIGADGTKMLNPNTDLFDPKYFYYYLTTLDIPSRGYNRHFGILKEKTVIRPSLSEQRSIACVLSTIQRAIEAQDKLIAAARELKKSLMRHLFTYGPVPLSEAERVPLKETEIGPVTEQWEVVRLEGVVRKTITDGTHRTPKYIEYGIPFVTAKNIVEGQIQWATCKSISSDEHEALIRRVKPERGDILLTKVGTVGNVAMVDTDMDFSIFVQVALIKPEPSQIDSKFLTYSLTSDLVQENIVKNAAQSTMKFIGTQKISKVLIHLPPMSEQQQIAGILSAVDKKIEAEQNRKAALQTLFQTMLHLLMTGKVRVKELISS